MKGLAPYKTLLALILVACLPLMLGAQGKRYAILVGVGDYADSSILKLATPRNDVMDLSATLRQAGWDKVFAMGDDLDYRNSDFPSKSNIIKKTSLLADLARPDDTVLLFFSGHGMADATGQYFLPVDADLQRLKESSVGLEALVAQFRTRGIDKIILAVDACRETLSQTKGLALVGLGGENKVNPQGPGLALYATQAGWYSFEDPRGRNGVFTAFLLAGLAGRADGAIIGTKADGSVSFGELATWIPEAVGSWALDNGKRQKPFSTKPSPSIAQLTVAKPGIQLAPPVGNEPITSQAVTTAFDSMTSEQAAMISLVDSASLSTGQKLKKAQEYLDLSREASYEVEPEKALAYYLGATRLDPELTSDVEARKIVEDAFASLVQNQLNEGEHSAALDLLESLIPRFPAAAVLYYQRGYTWQELGKPAQAVADYRKSQELGMADLMVDLNLALNLARLKKTSEAEASFKQAIAKTGDERWYALSEYGNWLAQEGRHEEALKNLSESFSLEKRAGTLLSKIYSLGKLGRKSEAAQEAPQARNLAQAQGEEWILEELQKMGY